jgi:hypothetical protein
MKRRTFFLTIILLMGCYIIGIAQVSEKQKYHTPDSADLLEGSGRIIHNGELIQPPYQIIADSSNISINGKNIYPQPKPNPDIKVDSGLIEQCMVLDSVFLYFDGWFDEVGWDSAIMLAYEYLTHQNIVDSVYFDKGSTLRVKFYSQEWPEALLFEPPSESTSDPRQSKFQFLQNQATEMNEFVANGGLIIISEGVVISRKYASLILKKIKAVMSNGELDHNGKISEIKKIVIDRKTAISIVNSWTCNSN